jgi:hypothetical protein
MQKLALDPLRTVSSAIPSGGVKPSVRQKALEDIDDAGRRIKELDAMKRPPLRKPLIDTDKLMSDFNRNTAARHKRETRQTYPWAFSASRPAVAGSVAQTVQQPTSEPLSFGAQLGIRALSLAGNAGPSTGPSTPAPRRTADERYYGKWGDKVDPPTVKQTENVDAWQKGQMSRSEFMRKMMLGM